VIIIAKRIKIKIGDLFIVPLDDENKKGVGRILKINEATVFIELYHMKPIVVANEFDFEEVKRNKPLVMAWCYDDGLKNGYWEIFDNQPIDDEIDMPFLWHQDAWDKKYYIKKGSPDSYRTVGERFEISEDDVLKYDPYGIGNVISKTRTYKRRLTENGLL
jgi:hypothetical protein